MKRVIWILLCLLCISAYAAEESSKITCTGRVIDVQGEPIANSKVTAYEMLDDMAGNTYLQLVGGVATKADGAFVFGAGLKPERRWREAVIVAAKEGLAIGWATWDMRGNTEATIELAEPEKLEGAVVDEIGQPIEGAEVQANLIRGKEWLPGIALLEQLAVKSDNKGQFRFNNLPADVDVGFLVTAAGRATTYTYQFGPPDLKEGARPQFRSGQTDIRVTLPAEARIEGRIVDSNSGQGVAGVKLAVVATFSPAFFYRFICESREDGSFDIGGLQTGEYLIRGDFPSLHVDTIGGKSTADVIIARDSDRRTELQVPKSDAELRKTVIESLETEIQFSLKIFEVLAGADVSQAGLGKGASNGVVVHAGQEYVNKLLALSEKNEDVRLLSSSSVGTYDDHEAGIFYGKELPYTAGYEPGTGERVTPKPIQKNTFDGIKVRVRGKIQTGGDTARVEVGVQRRKGAFETRQYTKGYDYQIPAIGSYFSTDVMTRKNEPVIFRCPRRDQPPLYLAMTTYWAGPVRDPESLVGKSLPEFENINIEFDPAKGKMVLVCFWDMQQRPSRHMVRELAKQSDKLTESGVVVACVQASNVDKAKLDEWVKENKIPFEVGMIESDEEKVHFEWGVKSLPWLILTDREQIVKAEGFSFAELDERIRENDTILKVDNQDVNSYSLTAVHSTRTEATFSKLTMLWMRTYDQFDTGIGEFVRETLDGGFIVVGTHIVNDSPQHLLVKTDSEGKIIWQKTFNKYNHHWDSSIELTSDGGYIFGGGASDAWLIKFNAMGKEIWQKSFGGDGYQYGRYAHQTQDGGYILVGGYGPPPPKGTPAPPTYSSLTKVWLIKTDSSGIIMWTKTFGSDKGSAGWSVQQTHDEGYVVAGAAWTSNLFKTDSLGNIEWEKTLKGNYGRPIPIECVQQTQDGGYVLVGWSKTDSPDQSAEKSDINLFKTDSFGNVQWRKVFDKKFDDAKFVQQTRDGGYIIAGNICDSWRSEDHDIWIIKTDSKGEITWQEIVGGDHWDQVLCIQQTADGGYVFAGSYGKSKGWRGKKMCLVRFK